MDMCISQGYQGGKASPGSRMLGTENSQQPPPQHHEMTAATGCTA